MCATACHSWIVSSAAGPGSVPVNWREVPSGVVMRRLPTRDWARTLKSARAGKVGAGAGIANSFTVWSP